MREIDPADLALFDEWYDAFRAGAVAGREAALVTGPEALGYSLRNPSPLKQRIVVGAFEDDRVLGTMLFEYRLNDNLDTVEVEIDVPPAHRRRGIGTALWQWAATRAAQLGRTIVQAEVAVPAAGSPGAAFAARLGFQVEHVEEHLVVPLPYDPSTGLLYTADATGAVYTVDPTTGASYAADPSTGYVYSADPVTGVVYGADPDTGAVWQVG